MDFLEFKEMMQECFRQNGIENLLDDDKSQKLYQFSNFLTEMNKTMNLTAITDERGVIFKHFADSAIAAKCFDVNKTVIDVGCGAGFPSVPLAILRLLLHSS